MKRTVILPGLSHRNRVWAEEMAAAVPGAEMHPWAHWEHGGHIDPPAEMQALLARIGQDEINLLSKSIGTRMAARLVTQIPAQIGKVICCGVPEAGEVVEAEFEAAFEALPAGQFLFIHNREDPVGEFDEVKVMLQRLASNLNFLERPRADHNYPYPEDFKAFLAEGE